MSLHFPAFKRDLIWSYASFVAIVLCGVIVNVCIGRLYGPAALGVFNLLYAVFVIASQFSVMGLHYSCLRHVAAEDNTLIQPLIGVNAAFCALFSSGFCAVLLMVFAPTFGRAFDSPEITKGIFFLAPGLVFLSLNKVMMWYINGQRRMVDLAKVNMARSALVVSALIILMALKAPTYALVFIFTLADGFLTLALITRFVRENSLCADMLNREWIMRHLAFGWKALWGGVIIETNFRVDVVMLGLLSTQATVGIYSLVAMVVEGVYQLLFVLRTVINPVLVRMLQNGDHDGIRALLRKAMVFLYPSMLIGIIFTAYSFEPVLQVAGLYQFMPGFTPLLILLCGLGLAAPFIPFHEIFMQAGKSGRYSQFMTFIVLTNVGLNALLIPWLGMAGAAFATASAFVLSIWYFNALCRRHLNIDLLGF